jgi:hypothetical protein
MKRYQLASMLGVNAENDDDGNASGQAGNGKKHTPPPQSEKQKAAQEERRRIEAARQTIKADWIAKAKEDGLLSETPTSDEWANLREIMGESYASVSTVKDGFDALRDTGLAIIAANASKSEQAIEEYVDEIATYFEDERAIESTPRPDDTA